MSNFRILATLLVAVFAFGQPTTAQSLTYALFERYVDALRQQAGIPGMAAAIVREGAPNTPDWERGFGVLSTEDRARTPVLPTTPFPVAQLSQSIGAALVLRHCIESGVAELTDLVQRWSSDFPDRRVTFADVLAHRRGGSFDYDPQRFASAVTGATEECGARPYANLVFEQIIDRFVMSDTVPGGDVQTRGAKVRRIFSTPDLRRFELVLLNMAAGHRVDAARRATPTVYRSPTLSAGDGLISSVHDLGLFEAALDDGALVSRRLLDEVVWVRQPGTPTGHGWFVQQVNGRRVVWQFGEVPGAYSSLLVKLPDEGLTLILLANSDGLTAPFPLQSGDVTVSPFANIFFSLLG